MEHPYTSPVVRKIWGKADTVLLIFGGAAAEFAVNKAVDWLYFTGKLPEDPLGRLFSTVAYASDIIFSQEQEAQAAIDRMRVIHTSVENARGAEIPDWAYRDVLYMLIHYSIAAYELIERKLTGMEKDEVVSVFFNVGTRMGMKDLPDNYISWLADYEQHLRSDLQHSKYTDHLFAQYRKHLGKFRFFILKEAQKALVPDHVRALLGFSRPVFFPLIVPAFRLSRTIKVDRIVKMVLLPEQYKQSIRRLDRQHT